MLAVDARLTTVDGKGFGPWRLYYRPQDLHEAAWAARNLVPTCEVRVRDGKTIVFGPTRAEQLQALRTEGELL